MSGVYILDDFSESPQLNQKMLSQSKEPTHGNNFISNCIGPGYNQLDHSFYHFFGCQDSLKIPQSKDDCPDLKVDKFFF